MPVVDAFLTLFILVAPFAAGAVLGYWLGRGWLGVVVAFALGFVLTLGGLGVWYLDAPRSSDDCYECNEYWGRWMDETMFTIWLPLTLILRSVGLAVGASKRRSGPSASVA